MSIYSKNYPLTFIHIRLSNITCILFTTIHILEREKNNFKYRNKSDFTDFLSPPLVLPVILPVQNDKQS